LAAALIAVGGPALAWRAFAPAADPEGPPTMAALQQAYDREKNAAGGLHDDDLEIVGVDCHAGAPARFLCQVGFVKQNDDPDRVFLDAALIERRAGGGWKLLRGLCKRLL
jgi:hypothetical protein